MHGLTPANPVNLIFPKTPSYGIDSRPNDTTVTAVKTFSAILVTASCIGAGSFQSVAAAPTVQALAPAPGVVSSLTRVTVTFSVAVNGPAAEDLLINGNSATSVSGSSNTWTFSFPQPAPGLVQCSWDASHGIYDLAGNRFDELAPGSTWSYTLVDTLPPVVQTVFPTPEAALGVLTRIEITFHEPVSGVDPADLVINGQPASSVTGIGAGPYLFAFTQPAAGAVTVSWAEAHGIQDTAPTPNPFGGGSWSYHLRAGLGSDVVLNEIMADNLNGLLDEDGDTSDWIELLNRGATSVNLLGWALTDDPQRRGEWVFPAITLGPGQYLLVFASGKDRATSGPGTNHANFTLAGSEYLGLYNAELPRQAVSEFAPVYPEQRGDIAWGRTASNTLAYFATATPGAPNASPSNYTGFAERPHASVGSGLFGSPFQLALSSATAGATIYYTLNGDVPTPASGTLYTGLIPIAGNRDKAAVPLRAAAYKTGLLPSSVLTRTYVFPDYVPQQPAAPPGYPTNWVSGNGKLTTSGDYEMDPQVLTNGNNAQVARQALAELPVVSLVAGINTFFAPTTGVYTARAKQGNQRQANVEMWLPNGQRLFQVECGFEVQGGSSPTDLNGDWKDKKLSLRLIFRGDFGTPKLHARIFNDTPVEEFDTLILDAGLNFWWTHMTDSDQRNRAKFITDQYTSDLMNNAGMVAQHGRFVHLYLNGLYWGLYDIHERMDESAAASYLGGQKEEWDVLKHTGDAVGLQNGTLTNYNAMFALARSGLANNAVYEQLQSFLDLPWFADYLIINFWVGNTDWPNHNWYAWRRSRTPGALPWRFVSWDAEHTVKSYSENRLGISDANSPGELFQLLRNNAEFKILFGDRVHKLLFNGGPLYSIPDQVAFWTPTNTADNVPATTYRRRVDEIWNSIVCESARWGDVATANTNNPYTRELHYTRELNALFTLTNITGQTPNYFPLRGSNVLAQFRLAGLYPTVAAPAFSQHGGRVAPGYQLGITNRNGSGSVYYTTNGVDPRAYGSGAVAPTALLYTGMPLALDRSMTVKARALVATNWSALDEASFTIGSLGVPLRITEIMYNPMPGPAPGNVYEFLELLNAGPTDLDLGGYSFAGVNFAFAPFFTLAAGARIVLASDANPLAFAARYPGVPVSGYFGGALNNAGERIAIKDPAGNIVLSVDYEDRNGWPAPAAGGGYSLEIIDLNGNPDDPANWRASSALNGTPGLPASNPPAASLLLNEVMADNRNTTNLAGAYPDWVELYNAGTAPLSLTGWSLSDNDDPRRFVFSDGPSLASGAYLVVFFDTNAAPGIHTGFSLDQDGGHVLLYDPNTNRIDAVSYGAQLPDYSIGRMAGAWRLNAPTPGGPNLPTATGPASDLVLNEWLANAVPGGTDWVELFNRSATRPIALNGLYLGAGGAVFRYTSLSFIAPGGFLQLLADETTGPAHLDFKLSAAGSSVALYDEAGLEVDRVTFGPQVEGISQGRLPDGGATIASFPGSASPGAANYVITYGGPFLNEVLARNEGGSVTPWGARADWVELANTNGTAVALGGFGLSDEPGTRKWSIPSGISIPASGYLRVWCDGDAPPSVIGGPDLNAGFSLASKSGGVYLFATNGLVEDYVEYGFQVADLSIGRSGATWRLLATPSPGASNSLPASLGNASSLRFNEWLSDPASGHDWFELYNPGTAPVELSGLYLTDDPALTARDQFRIAPLSFLGGLGFAQFEADGDPSQGHHHVNFHLDSGGDALRLYDAGFGAIDAVDFGAIAPGVSMGRLPDGSGTLATFPGNPTPGQSNYRPLENAAINEVLADSADPLEDAIEIYNPTGLGIEVGGWFLSDSARDAKKYRIPNGTFLAAGGYLVFYESQFNAAGPGAFALSPAGGEVLLSEADAAGTLSGFRAVAKFGPALTGVSWGRVETCSGADFAALRRRSFGQDAPGSLAQFRTGAGLFNGDALVGPVVINEVMYHPASGGLEDNTLDEYLELLNATAAPVSLFDPAHPANTWKISSGVQFTLPQNVTLPAGGFALLVNFNPAANPTQLAAFRTSYGVPMEVPVLGPYGGKLANDGETLELLQPRAPASDGFVAYAVVDRVSYTAANPWPAEGNGTGFSLQRRAALEYGNDPGNWLAAEPTAGLANVAQLSRPLSIVAQPVSRAVIPGSRVVFSVTGCGSRPLSYQWKHDGANIEDGTNATLVLAAVQPPDAGSYTVRVSSGADDILSAPATLALTSLPVITIQPQGQSVGVGLTATFTVEAMGPGPLTYQWRRNGQPLPGATQASLVLENLRAIDAAGYSVLVINAAGAVPSAVAALLVLVPPEITQQPQNQSVAPGSTATFAVAATGVGTLRYQWQFNGANLAEATQATLTITNAQLPNEGDYRVLVTDDITTGQSQLARLTVRVPPVILIPPRGQTNVVGATMSFTVVASGSVPMGFRWNKGSVPILTNVLNTTNCTFTITNALTSTSGVYRVVITNSGNLNLVVNATFNVLVVAPPVITLQPLSQSVDAGADVTFTVGVAGTAPGYQWRFGGTDLPGATNISLTITNVQLANQGSYQLVASNLAGMVISAVARLTLTGTPILQDLARLPDGSVRLDLSGTPNRNYAIEAAPDLAHWTVLTTIAYTNGVMPLIDPSGAAMTNRFYRARLVP